MIGAIDIGGTKVAVGVVDPDRAEVRACRELESTRVVTPGDQGIAEVTAALGRLAAEAGATLEGIGIACTGPVDPITGIIGQVDTISGWIGLNLVEQFGRAFPVPIAVENDADACALAEGAWGAGRGVARFIYITVSTGIGGGAVFDGKLYRGIAGGHPEFGHHVIEAWAGPECYCGARGCWEALASGPAMAAWYGRQTGLRDVTAREVCERAKAGEGIAQRAAHREAIYLGIGFANLIAIFAPDLIAVGGGVARSWELFESPIAELLRPAVKMVPQAESTVLARASLGEGLPLLGAARVWLHRYA